MSSPSEINGLTPAEIFRNGTRKRLRPFTGIGVMEMLRAIGHTHKSYTEWCEGISDFKYETIRRIDRFFADRGLTGFAAEFVPGLPAAAGDIRSEAPRGGKELDRKGSTRGAPLH